MINTTNSGLLAYSTTEWPFAAILSRDVFKVRQLHRLHEFVLEKKQRLGGKPELTYDDNLRMRRLMQDLGDDSAFYKLYHAFMSKVLSPVAGCPLSYSSHPKMRVHFAGTPSVSAFHDDVSVTGRIDQVNLWIPFTDVEGSASMWVESDCGCGDYAPVAVKYGQALIFDGGYLSHGTYPNNTTTTRISMDLRFSLKNGRTREDGIWLLDRVLSRLAARNSKSVEFHTRGTT
ncbi:MAG: hypothetical protein OEU68_04090 [Nitrospira sp.]|nr:hypothetical protein [Nitrospira sp.]MDH4242684.1 hypothetical protein [Nitrospira sp.]MDH4355047.1 hypothetical protein [Nitrospira sp.]MDH5316967.1 hypothetical protein [Nitrospira sp.]